MWDWQSTVQILATYLLVITNLIRARHCVLFTSFEMSEIHCPMSLIVVGSGLGTLWCSSYCDWNFKHIKPYSWFIFRRWKIVQLSSPSPKSSPLIQIQKKSQIQKSNWDLGPMAVYSGFLNFSKRSLQAWETSRRVISVKFGQNSCDVCPL